VCSLGYSSDVLLARERNPDLAFTIPEAGGLRRVDSLCIPVDAPNPGGANAFIEFYLRPEVSALNAAAVQVDTGNQAAVEFVPQAVLDDPVIYPPEDVLSRLVVIENLGDADELYDDGWARVEEA
jgi:spermidine/putrescine transport system substrate-binding protein